MEKEPHGIGGSGPVLKLVKAGLPFIFSSRSNAVDEIGNYNE